MKANINILDIGNDVTDTWTRRFRFTYNGRAVVEADLCWTGEPCGYELYIENIECDEDDPSAQREVEQAVHAWAESLTQHDLYQLDEQTNEAREVLS